MLKTQHIEYFDDGELLEGYIAYDDKNIEPKPIILIVHDWSGRNEFSESKAAILAELGYVGFAIDMYGKGKLGKTNEEKAALMDPLLADRPKLQKRVLAAFKAAKKLPHGNPELIGIMGYCFGGLCALDLARCGADIKGAVSIHGNLSAPEGLKSKITAKVLALHGFDDPSVTPEKAMKFGEEMTHAQVDWQLCIYGNAMHAFANPQANEPKAGRLYNKKADTRSWLAMREFFKEAFSK